MILLAFAICEDKAISDKLLEAINHIRHLQAKLIELEKKRDEQKATVKPFFGSSFCFQNSENCPGSTFKCAGQVPDN